MFSRKVVPFAFLSAALALAVGVTDRLTVADREPRPGYVLSGDYHLPGDYGRPDWFELTVAPDGGGLDVRAAADREAAVDARKGDRVLIVKRYGVFHLSEEVRVRALPGKEQAGR